MRQRAHILISLLAAAALVAGAAACGETTYEFDEVSSGHDDADDVPRAKSNSQWLRAVYADVLGRAPESYAFDVVDTGGNVLLTIPITEQDLLLDMLEGVGDPAPLRAIIAAGLTRSDEVDLPDKADVADPAAWIAEQFRHYLGREPNAYELAAFVDEWQRDPAVGPRTVVRALVGSREYGSN
jgi:hypothetical protein